MPELENAAITQEKRARHVSMYHLLATVAAVACLLTIVDGVIPQFQMHAFGGHMPIGNVLAKIVLLFSLALGVLLRPRITLRGLPISAWKVCVAFLALEIGYLVFGRDMTLGDVLQSYNAYYLLPLIGPAVLPFRGAVSERVLLRCIISLFLVSAAIGFAQYFTRQPLLYTQSADGAFTVWSYQFFDSVRAFGLFSTAMNFGLFCSLCGALGIALCAEHPVRGISLTLLSAFSCYTTLVRTCYLMFFCACTYAALITFGRKANRGLWQPLLYFGLGIATILYGARSMGSDSSDGLENATSLIDRLIEWTYYTQLFVRSSPAAQLFGLGLVQNDKVSLAQSTPAAIDNLPLALTMHIGLIGLVVFSVLLVRMWLSLRRAALTDRQPFIVAAASLLATLGCSGTFNMMLSPFGAVFALSILCERRAHECSVSGAAGIKMPERSPLAAAARPSS